MRTKRVLPEWLCGAHRLVVSLALLLSLSTSSIISSPRAHAQGTTYYVNTNTSICSDSGAGTSSQPWCTFTPINNHGAFSPGDQILLASGDT